MKSLYFLSMAALITFNSSAQTITSFTVVPANPTTADTVTVYVQTDFPNSACEGQTFLTGISGSDINAGGLHCMGTFTAFCTDIDTVIIPPLPAGQYTLHFMLTTGSTSGCIFGILPLVFDSTHFTVSPATGLNEINQHNSIQIIPNPSDGKFVLKHNMVESSLIAIFSIDGRIIQSFNTIGKEPEINNSLPPGIYMLSMQNTKGKWFSRIVVQ